MNIRCFPTILISWQYLPLSLKVLLRIDRQGQPADQWPLKFFERFLIRPMLIQLEWLISLAGQDWTPVPGVLYGSESEIFSQSQVQSDFATPRSWPTSLKIRPSTSSFSWSYFLATILRPQPATTYTPTTIQIPEGRHNSWHTKLGEISLEWTWAIGKILQDDAKEGYNLYRSCDPSPDGILW